MAFSEVLECIRKGDFTQAKTELKIVIDEGKIEPKDVENIKKYYSKNNSPYVAYILYRAQCSCKMVNDAFDTYMLLLRQCSRKRDVMFSELLDKASEDEIKNIYNKLIAMLEDDIDIPQSILVSDVVDYIVPVIWDMKNEDKYQMIASIASHIWFGDLKNSEYIYYMAYSCANVEDDLAEKLYLKLIQKEPANAEALNDIGLMYEKKTDYAKAKFYFSKAYMFCDTNKTYKKNLDRVISKK